MCAKDDFELSCCGERASAFVEDLGIVFLDPKWLVRADVLEPSLKETGWKGQ
ncbi:hypothetical protein ACPOL_2704 [Acidisarcina polymorpha]|uniref:Uncharacterized protein n=1 Tax=Acidisarcina polymorpha TaxID=2211140 RepID=A0A2Z5FZU7_9BACT|nr:hypothetical protein ACPOL_2704 [Acidisarcina polymorpha]